MKKISKNIILGRSPEMTERRFHEIYQVDDEKIIIKVHPINGSVPFKVEESPNCRNVLFTTSCCAFLLHSRKLSGYANFFD